MFDFVFLMHVFLVVSTSAIDCLERLVSEVSVEWDVKPLLYSTLYILLVCYMRLKPGHQLLGSLSHEKPMTFSQISLSDHIHHIEVALYTGLFPPTDLVIK